jgi:hypothetical protein
MVDGPRGTVHDNGTGYGIYGVRNERNAGMQSWMKEHGYPKDSLEGQSRYMAHEAMSKNYGPSRNALMGATKDNIADVNKTLSDNFEAPAIRNYGRRLQDTNTALNTKPDANPPSNTQNAASAPQPPTVPAGVNPPGHIGDDRDQSLHTTHMSGQVTMDGQSYGWGSGMPGHPATPFGDYYINRGNLGGLDPDTGNPKGGGVGPLGQSGWGGKLPPAIAGLNTSPEGNMRGGEELHAGSATSDRLDQLYTAGCFAVAKDQWPQFKANLMAKAQREGKLMLHLHPSKDGKPIASITGTNGTSRVATTNASPIPAGGLRPFPTDGLNPPKASADAIPDAARNPGSARSSLADDDAHKSLAPAEATIGRMSMRSPGELKKPGELSANAGKADSMTHKVEGTGHIKVDVNGPAGTKASAKGSGLFANKTTINRNLANQRSAEHVAQNRSN